MTPFLNRYWYLLTALVRRDFKIRYASTVFGLGWSVLQPLGLLLLYVFVFSAILKVQVRSEEGPGGFVLYLLCGYLPFIATSEAVHRGSVALTENRSLLKKMIFPAEVLPAVGVISATVAEIIGLLLLVVLALLSGIRPSAWLLFLPILILLRIGISIGLAWLVSVLSVFFNDFSQILGLFMTAWMFLTPIFYPVSAVPEHLAFLLALNPLHYLIRGYRAVILQAHNPGSDLVILAIFSSLVGSLGLWFFRKTIDRAKDLL
jgi:ABC-type polysaccharide/polyol phosphate export permease